MITTKHFMTRASSRNVSNLCTNIIYLFGSQLDGRDGLQLDYKTYKELINIGNNSIKNNRV